MCLGSDLVTALWTALGDLASPIMILTLLGGLVVGFLAGLLPGFSSSNAAAIILPFTIGLDLSLSQTLLLLAGVYAGSQYAGAIPAILINVPGDAGSAVTALDGHPMTVRGRGSEAIGIARMASAFGGVAAGLVVLVAMAPLAAIALRFGAREMFVVGLLATSLVATLVGDSPRRGFLSALLGALLGVTGASTITGIPRVSFDRIEFFDGIPFIPMIVGLFAFTEMFLLASRSSVVDIEHDQVGEGGDHGTRPQPVRDGMLSGVVSGIRLTFSYPATLIRSTGLGMLLGVMPGVGAASAGFLSYAAAKRRSKNSETFGTGNPEGVVAAETSDNAVTATALVPLLMLGIPGSATTAIMLGAFLVNGVPVGPRIMENNPEVAYLLVLAIIAASALILPIGILLAAPMVQMTRVPTRYLVPIVLIIATVGAFAWRGSYVDIVVALVFGVLGLAMRYFRYPVIPLLLGYILAPLIENNWARASRLSNGELTYYAGSWISLALWSLLALTIAIAIHKSFRNRRHQTPTSLADVGEMKQP